MTKDYYKVLNIQKNASQDEIKQAYKRLAKQYHPDINKDSNATEKFKEINEAAATLGNPDKRAHYDQYGTAEAGDFSQGFGGFDFRNFSGGFDFDDVFDNLFAGFGFDTGRNRRSRARNGSDLAYELEITLEDVAHGLTKKIGLDKYDVCDTCNGTGAEKKSGMESCDTCKGHGAVKHIRKTPFGVFSTATTCSTCNGSGQVIKNPCKNCDGKGRIKTSKTIDVKIPVGVDDGTRLRIRGEGEAGERGASPGDLYVIIRIQKHDTFERDGSDIYLNLSITVVQACLGDDIEIPTIDGTTTLKIPAGTQPDTVLRMRGKGLPCLDGDTGDQNIRITVEIPTKLSKEQTKILEEFSQTLKKKKGWFS